MAKPLSVTVLFQAATTIILIVFFVLDGGALFMICAVISAAVTVRYVNISAEMARHRCHSTAATSEAFL